MAQRTVYDHALPAGTSKRAAEKLAADVRAAHPGADVDLVAATVERRTYYRVVATLPKPKPTKGSTR